jgi:PAS domain S-box-containing protein
MPTEKPGETVSPAPESHPAFENDRELLRSIIDSLPLNIYVKDLQGRYLIDNVAHAKFLGVANPADVIGKTVFDFFPKDLAERYTADDQQVLQSKTAIWNQEEPITAPGRETRWTSTSKVPMRNESGEVIALICFSRDVTRRKQSDEQIHEMQAFLDSIVENIPNMIFVKDAADLRFVRVNRAGEKLLGCSRADLIGKSDYDLFPASEAEFFTAKDRVVLESGKLLDIPAEPLKTPAGIRVLHTQKIPICDDGGKPSFLLGISEDITQRTAAEEQLRQQNVLLQKLAESERAANEALRKAQTQMVETEKLAAIGMLVAGVAHEINNPLAFVTNNVAVLQRDLAALWQILELYRAAEPTIAVGNAEIMHKITVLADRIDLSYILKSIPEMMTRSREGLKRIQQIVSDLRDFARHESASEVQPGVDINAGIASTLNIVRGRAQRNQIQIVSDLGQLPAITCQQARINQVVLNLVANAIDACSEKGTVTVRTRAVADGIEIDVRDNGVGIPPNIRDKIFDPFFTTKPQGHGTGLGLSVSHGIVAAHGGQIEVESEPGEGSTFRVRLPRVPPRPSGA